MSINQAALARPIKENLVIVDDVITMGASFKAAKILVERAEIQTQVVGLFLAKTIWPPSELDDWLAALWQVGKPLLSQMTAGDSRQRREFPDHQLRRKRKPTW